MIVTSLLLILAAIAMLVLGLVGGSSQLLVGSIAASLLAAIALVIGARQSAAARAAAGYRDGVDGEADLARAPARERVAAGAPGQPPYAPGAAADATTESFPAVPPPERPPGPEMGASRPPLGPPAGMDVPAPADVPAAPPVEAALPHDQLVDEDDPPDEPARQRTSPADTARVARMSTPVLVVDGRPRYHLPGCVHLLGRDSEPLPVAEAVELGFSPCSLCEPDTALLADAR